MGLLFAPMDESRALPPGRSWASAERLSVPHVVRFAGPRLEVTPDGVLMLAAMARWDTTTSIRHDWARFFWGDSNWVAGVFTGVKAGGVAEPVLSLTDDRFLVWLVEEPISLYGYILLSKILPDGLSPPDTVMLTSTQDSEYSAAVSRHRRWVARSDQIPPVRNIKVRVAVSDDGGPWRELPRQGINELMCTIAPLSDSSAMLSFAGRSGLAWVRFEGDRMAGAGYLDSRPDVPLHPRFRFRPSGGLWLLWTESRWVHVSSYSDGVWSRGDSLRSVHPAGQTFVSAWCDASRDTAERPVLAWVDLGYGYTYRDVGCVAFPTESGWAPGEEIPGSDGLFANPVVTRDLNGDAWLAWTYVIVGGIKYTHTYTSATCSAPRVLGPRAHPLMTWTLSEPAPGSWWMVQRARGEEEFESVARVQAGAGPALTFTDTTAPHGKQLRYRIRRECVDVRYQWLSEESEWRARGNVFAIKPKNASPLGATAVFTVEGAESGLLNVRLYDIQGRVMLRREVAWTAGASPTLSLDLGADRTRLRSGIYFLRATDAAGQESEAVRVLVLR